MSCGGPPKPFCAGCGKASCTSGSCLQDRDQKFTTISGEFCSLTQKMIPTVDRLRDLYTRFGARLYTVTMVHTRWTGGVRGVGQEVVVSEVTILPTPKVSDLSALSQLTTPIGSQETGTLRVSEISGCYSEEMLSGEINGRQPDESENFFYEVTFLRPDGQPSDRRRFLPGTPSYDALRFEWTVDLDRAYDNRTPYGEPSG